MRWKPITVMGAPRSMAARIAPKLVIFSDLDGTFLDHDSYAFDEALPAYNDCLSRGVLVVFCSSKTRAEIEPIHRELGGCAPFISENGGAIFIPRGYFPFTVDFHLAFDGYGVIRLGARYSALTSALDRLSRNLGISIRAFHQMKSAQIAAETGLPYWKAEVARAREYDEPFVFTNETTPDVDGFLKAVGFLGLRWTRGGRFDHLLGHAGKRPAVSILTSLYRRWNPEISIAGLGDSANDTGVLSAVDVAILVQKPGGGYDPVVTHAMPGVHRSPLPGPRGWTASSGVCSRNWTNSQDHTARPTSSRGYGGQVSMNQSRRVKFPVDNTLTNQLKCRTQAFKQLLSMPPPTIKTTSRTWRLTYIIEDFLSYLRVLSVRLRNAGPFRKGSLGRPTNASR